MGKNNTNKQAKNIQAKKYMQTQQKNTGKKIKHTGKEKKHTGKEKQTHRQ